MSGAPDPARRAAYEVLRRCFEHDAWADRAFPAAAERHRLAGQARARAQWLAYGSVQRRGTSDRLIARLADRDPERLDGPVLAALRLGLFELLHAARPADHAAVADAVELAKRGLRARGARRAGAGAGLVNALLRRAARERRAILAALDDRDPDAAAEMHSLPGWLTAMWWRELGPQAARSLCAAANAALPTALRLNTLRRPLAAHAPLRRAGLAADATAERRPPLWPAEAVAFEGPLPEAALAALAAGEAFAQSLGAQAVVEILDPRPGERVLDLCAGPGLKAVAIAARMEGRGEVVAVEVDRGRARQVAELADRAGAGNVRVIAGDGRRPLAGRGYDRVLVDAPCSDLGTLASRPDLRWRKRPEAIPELAALQAELVASGLAALRPGGTLVYSTCTVSRRENEEVAAGATALACDLGARAPGLASAHDPRFLQIRADRDRTDSFFVARLRSEPGDG